MRSGCCGWRAGCASPCGRTTRPISARARPPPLGRRPLRRPCNRARLNESVLSCPHAWESALDRIAAYVRSITTDEIERISQADRQRLATALRQVADRLALAPAAPQRVLEA